MVWALFHLIRALSMKWVLAPTKEFLSSKKGFIMEIYLKGVKKYD
jgi:hypothetical protein